MRTEVLRKHRTEVVTTNQFYSGRSTGGDRTDEGRRQPEVKAEVKKN
ncbi:MAG: hypothetical protein ABI180_16930 [Microcoleus sp.]